MQFSCSTGMFFLMKQKQLEPSWLSFCHWVWLLELLCPSFSEHWSNWKLNFYYWFYWKLPGHYWVNWKTNSLFLSGLSGKKPFIKTHLFGVHGLS